MYLILVLLIFILCLLFLYDYSLKKGYRWKKLSAFPGDAPLPLIGNSLQLGFDADYSSQKLLAMWEKHGMQNFRLSVGSEDWIMLTNPDDVGTILNHKSELSKPLERNIAMKPFFGNSVSTSEGERWKSTRKLMMPSFHFRTMEGKLKYINKYCNQLFNIFDTYGDGPVEVYRYLRPYMFDILCHTLMGVETHLLADPDHQYLKASGEAIRIITYNYFSYWRNIRFLFMMTPLYTEMISHINTIKQMSTHIITERNKKLNHFIEETRRNNNIEIDIQKLIENKLNNDAYLLDGFLMNKPTESITTPEEIVNDEVSLVCFTGHYTTTITISHTLYCLAKYPEVQKRVLEEQRAVFNNDFNKKPTVHDLNEMKYLEAVIKESIRVIPTVTKIGRQLQNDLMFKDGRIAPAGTSVIILYEAIYKDPKTFPEPEKFIPERFFKPMHNFAFVPFSAGPRNCIGFRYAWVAMKATLSNILRKYEICLGDTEPKFVHRIITESKNGLQIRFKKRH